MDDKRIMWLWDEGERLRQRLIEVEDSARSHLITLSSLLLGLSLLALQVNDPESGWAIITAWCLFGIATVGGAIREIVEAKWRRENIAWWNKVIAAFVESSKSGNPESLPETTDRGGQKTLLNWLTVGLISTGVIFLIWFAIPNLN